jgi:hypothetical protein
MKPVDGVTAIALILIASFAIERIVTAAMFLLSFLSPSLEPSLIEAPGARAVAERRYKLAYVTLAGLLAILVLAYYGGVRVFAAMGVPTDPLLDTLFTGIILVGGADRVAAVLKVTGEAPSQKPAPQPIQITGKLTLEDGQGGRVGQPQEVLPEHAPRG